MDNVLTELGRKWNTDKVDHAYLPEFDRRFRDLRNKPIRLLEIGLDRWASLRMWQEYFSVGTICGIDRKDRRTEKLDVDEGFQVFWGQQEDTAFLECVIEQTDPFDIIIDDASHKGLHHVTSFEALWPHVKPGGWYAIEDCMSLYNSCWTQPDDPTIIDYLNARWQDILLSRSDIVEVTIMGCDTPLVVGRNNGLIFFRKGATPC